ncbi:MAG TPA: SiaB family protein kinase [Tenuifilaceae bacterium]|nr:SiaB family protein kinase [Tenuifilaceae bacterium]
MDNGEVILNHKGPLSYEEIGFLLNRMTMLLDKLGMNVTTKKKAYSAMVESLENIYKHQDIIADDFEHVPQFTMEQCNESFCISASNSIMNHKIPALKEKLDKVNSLDKDGLKDLYKSTILSGNVSQKGGAGLGIINIAKVSENKISYAFKKLSDTHSYFTIKVTISHNNNK